MHTIAEIKLGTSFVTKDLSIIWGVFAEKYCLVLNEKGKPAREITSQEAEEIIKQNSK
jgi:hypothetical protein